MNILKSKMLRMIIGSVVAIIVIAVVGILLFINQPSFGRAPRGERLERIMRSPHYRDGAFHNEQEVPMFTSDKSRVAGIFEFLFRKKEGLRPEKPLPVIKTDLKKIPVNENVLVWFGHSSYLIQVDGRRILVDPVFCCASPVSFINRPFQGTDVYRPEDMPDIDYLIISHDHWDHLDYETVTALKDRVGKVICALGIGEHFEYWGFNKDRIIELDWNEDAALGSGFTFHCLPARHFSGRGTNPNQTLWASYLVETPSQNIYVAGDGGYDSHFAAIGERFPDIDLAILENGQYNEEWRYIHLMPEYMAQAAKDLKANKILTVHHSKYALAKHRWDEPLANAHHLAEKDSLNVLIPQMGEKVKL